MQNEMEPRYMRGIGLDVTRVVTCLPGASQGRTLVANQLGPVEYAVPVCRRPEMLVRPWYQAPPTAFYAVPSCRHCRAEMDRALRHMRA